MMNEERQMFRKAIPLKTVDSVFCFMLICFLVHLNIRGRFHSGRLKNYLEQTAPIINTEKNKKADIVKNDTEVNITIDSISRIDPPKINPSSSVNSFLFFTGIEIDCFLGLDSISLFIFFSSEIQKIITAIAIELAKKMDGKWMCCVIFFCYIRIYGQPRSLA